MALRRDRFVLDEAQVIGVVRSDSTYERKHKWKPSAGDGAEEVHSYHLEIALHDHDNLYVNYDEDKATRDADFEVVAAVIP